MTGPRSNPAPSAEPDTPPTLVELQSFLAWLASSTWIREPEDEKALRWLAGALPALIAARNENAKLKEIARVAVDQCEAICDDGSSRVATYCANIVLAVAAKNATEIAAAVSRPLESDR
jgi:hypothetical protein